MAEVEPRVAQLEHDMQSVKSRLEAVDDDMRNIPDLINTQFRLVNSQFSRVFLEMETMRRDLGREIAALREEVRALPRAIAEMIAEQKGGG
jgi:hypothetical protein